MTFCLVNSAVAGATWPATDERTTSGQEPDRWGATRVALTLYFKDIKELSEECEEMARIRRVRWIAMAAVTGAVVATFLIGAQGFAARGEAQCQSHSTTSTVQGNHSWRAGGIRSAGCRAWRHLHHHRIYARTSS